MSAPASIQTLPTGATQYPLRARRLGIHTHQEAVVYMRADCHVCRSEGLTPQSRVLLTVGSREVVATLHQVSSEIVSADDAGLSEVAWERLGVSDGDAVIATHAPPIESLHSVRKRIYGHRLDEA